MHVKLCFKKNTACLYTFVKMSLYNSEENICSVYLRNRSAPIEPTVKNCDISDNNSLQKCVIADVTGK